MVLVVIVIMALGFWSNTNRSREKVTVLEDSTIKTKVIKSKDITAIKTVPQISIKNNTAIKAEEININDNKLMYELSKQQFSEEPVIEYVSVMTIDSTCQQSSYYTLNVEEKKYTKKAQLMLAKNTEWCKDFLEAYPLIGKYNKSDKDRMLLLKLASESQYAEFVQKAMGVKYMDDEAKNQLFEEAVAYVLKSQSAPLITILQNVPRDNETQMYMHKLSTILGTLNLIYTRQILQQATILYSCRYSQSITCSPSALYMLQQCIEYEEACGLDVLTWFELNHTKAHNRDIANLIAYFESL